MSLIIFSSSIFLDSFFVTIWTTCGSYTLDLCLNIIFGTNVVISQVFFSDMTVYGPEAFFIFLKNVIFKLIT